jgi:methylamine--corrinoid protein Co-methyltransferase
MQLGNGKDEFSVVNRKPSDGKRISTWLGPFGILVDENLYIPICQSAAAYTIVDALIPANLSTIYGRDLRGGTPYETLAGKYEVTLQKEALRRARRFGMPAQGGCTSPTEYGNFGGVGIPGAADPKNNLNVALCPSELKIDYRILHKVAHFLNCETYIYAGHFSMIGGFAGSIEGAALTSIAAAILLTSVCQASFQYVPTLNALLQCNSSRETAWTTSISAQALSQNTHLLTGGVVNPVAGPCTEMMLYEIAVSALFNSVSGFSFSEGVRSAGGKYPNYSTGLESKFAGEILKSNTGMSRDKAKEIIKTILPKYEQKLERPPKGKSFTECFDLKSLTPSREWLDIYDKVRTNLENLGVSFNAESN